MHVTLVFQSIELDWIERKFAVTVIGCRDLFTCLPHDSTVYDIVLIVDHAPLSVALSFSIYYKLLPHSNFWICKIFFLVYNGFSELSSRTWSQIVKPATTLDLFQGIGLKSKRLQRGFSQRRPATPHSL